MVGVTRKWHHKACSMHVGGSPDGMLQSLFMSFMLASSGYKMLSLSQFCQNLSQCYFHAPGGSEAAWVGVN
jgi:hypothetical protein